MTIEITRHVKATVHVSAFDLGQAFAEMNNEDQAQFFNGIATAIKDWPSPACFQWDMIRREMKGLPAALAVFKDMAEYATDDGEDK
jgi:hypothetical protein